ncbi:MAG: hypothetical protein OZX49_00562 [Immundisolibacter sp.]|jgi:hypothetical protein|nr:hypothetical protein [Immundisolibacter sp.]
MDAAFAGALPQLHDRPGNSLTHMADRIASVRRPNRWLLIGLAALVVAIYSLTIMVQMG